jgi:hypothetical protein
MVSPSAGLQRSVRYWENGDRNVGDRIEKRSAPGPAVVEDHHAIAKEDPGLL